jgi:hypothetical protein
VDDVDGVVGVQNENHLQEAVTPAPAPDQVFPVAAVPRPRGFRVLDHSFRLFRIGSVRGDMLEIPIVPAEFHLLTGSSISRSDNFFNKKWPGWGQVVMKEIPAEDGGERVEVVDLKRKEATNSKER